jgi:S-adenosylmethionine hydrolase
VVLAVVDPGVGTTRPAVAVLSRSGRTFVGPDNGLLSQAVELSGGPAAVVHLRRGAASHARGAHAGPTFDGRDLFAPAVGRLCLGADLGSLGTPVEPSSLVAIELAGWSRDGDAIVAQVAWVDRYGNAQLSVGPEQVGHLGASVAVEIGGRRSEARRVVAFADLARSELGLLTDSAGGLALVLNGRPAAAELGVAAGSQVRLSPAG